MNAAGPRTRPHVPFIEGGDPESAHEHGERPPTAPREDDLVGTAGTHGPRRDLRAEEPSGELAPEADAEGGGPP